MNASLLSIVFSTLLAIQALVIISCHKSDTPYFEVWDQAVNLYFKRPSDPQEALRILRNACLYGSEMRDVSCYNLGILYEYEKDQENAIWAYKRAWGIEPLSIYREAWGNLSGEAHKTGKPYLDRYRETVQWCRQNRPDLAILSLQKLVEESQEPISAKSLKHPFLNSCMNHSPDYYKLIARLPEKAQDLKKQSRRILADRSPFKNLWDMEFALQEIRRGETEPSKERRIHHPATLAWNRVLSAAEAGDEKRSLQELDTFHKALSSRARTEEEIRLANSIRMAAALLILQDPWFSKIRSSEEIRAKVEPWGR